MLFFVQLPNAPRLPGVGGGMGVSGDKCINYKLRLFTPRSSYGAKEMAPKSQLCACSFQDSLRQKQWVLEQIRGAFHSTKNSGNSGFGSEWNRHFPEFHSEILGVPREVGLKFRKIGITGKFRSIRPFLLAPSFSEPGNRTQRGFQSFCSISVFRLLLCDR